MMPCEAKGAKVQQMLEAKNAANTATATGNWIDVRGMVGTLLVVQSVGAITGNIVGSLNTADASNGNGEAALTFDDGNNFAAVAAANNIQAKTVDANKTKGWIKYVGTIGTGPAVVDVIVASRPKETT